MGGATHVDIFREFHHLFSLPMGEGRISARETSARNSGEGFSIMY